MRTIGIADGRYTATETVVWANGKAFTMTYDVTPRRGTLESDLGDGVTVVRRERPRRRGAEWVAPYAVNCAAHGWIDCRRTVSECEQDGRAHIASEHTPAP